jgi:Fe-S cluster assembly protein SufD
VKVTSLAAALASDASLVEKHLLHYARPDANSFVALNTAFFQDGAFIYVPAGQAVAEPVQLIFVSTGREHGAASRTRATSSWPNAAHSSWSLKIL